MRCNRDTTLATDMMHSVQNTPLAFDGNQSEAIRRSMQMKTQSRMSRSLG